MASIEDAGTDVSDDDSTAHKLFGVKEEVVGTASPPPPPRATISSYSPAGSASTSSSSSFGSPLDSTSSPYHPQQQQQRRLPLRRESFEMAQKDGRRSSLSTSQSTSRPAPPGFSSTSSSSSISTSQLVADVGRPMHAQPKLDAMSTNDEAEQSDSTDISLSILKRNYDIVKDAAVPREHDSSLNNSLIENVMPSSSLHDPR